MAVAGEHCRRPAVSMTPGPITIAMYGTVGVPSVRQDMFCSSLIDSDIDNYNLLTSHESILYPIPTRHAGRFVISR